MELRYKFSEDEFLALCQENLGREKTTVFEDLYEALIHFFSTPDSVLITDIKHNYPFEYYDDHLSLKEYIDKGKMIIPYLQFELHSDKVTDLEVTDVKLPSFILLCDFLYGGGVTRKYNIKNTKMKTKNKTSIRLLSVEFPQALLTKLNSRMTPPKSLLPSKLGFYEWRQTFYNKVTGESFFCLCFKDAIFREQNGLMVRHAHLKNALEKQSFKESICHICTNTNSDLVFGGSVFKGRYGAYITKHSIQEGISERESENYIRELKGVARIGERWVNETLLFNYINLLFPQYTVQREASPSWLNRQRFDVYIPELNLAIEYQGQQHYLAVDLFGGEEGLKRTKQRDKEKLQLSKANGVEIIYFSYKDNLTEKLVQNRLKNYLKEPL
ncbi:hypothetical protein [Acinetobacter sp. ASP199]|uniref:hypothetical protein n=1 Tax=unclassified Acinetobacter TaxID=196816 RepID=UPI001F6243D1|nr:hypothetical protein [Acinetobacter sp. ASP199]UNT60320.1 hypothetical protein IHE35_05810 [Acinetobacter sp. ASP199]